MFILKGFGDLVSRVVKINSINVIRKLSLEMNGKELIKIEKLDKVMLIGINRPEKKNCVNLETAKCLKAAFENFENDSSAAVAVLYGIGGSFCSGFDLSELTNIKDENIADYLENGLSFMGPTRMLTTKPIIGAISGYAVAGGLELALMCDLRVMEETAVMGVFCRRFGVPLIDGGTVRLPKLIGLSRALDLILTGRGVQGKEAFEMGLANRLVACGTALGQSISLANSIAKFPQNCVRVDRKCAYYSTFDAKSLEDALNYELVGAADIVQTEGKTGAAKFQNGVGKHGSFNISKPKL